MTIDEIRENFALLDDWDDRYRYVIELGRTLEPMSEAEHSAANKVQGCASQVWLSKRIDRNNGNEPVLNYLGDSDAHIVRGLIAILLTLYSGHTPQQILSTDAIALLDEFGQLREVQPCIGKDVRRAVFGGLGNHNIIRVHLLHGLFQGCHVVDHRKTSFGVTVVRVT